MKKVNTVRTLCIGASYMSEGSTAFIKYEKEGHLYWMFAELVKLTDSRAHFIPCYSKRSSKRVILKPEEIMIITDKNIPSEIAAMLLAKGGSIESHPEIRTNAEGTMNENAYRKYIQFICETEWKKQEWEDKNADEKRDYYNEMYELSSDILVKSCEDCCRCSQVKVKSINEDDECLTEEKLYCEKHREYVTKCDYCKDWKPV